MHGQQDGIASAPVGRHVCVLALRRCCCLAHARLCRRRLLHWRCPCKHIADLLEDLLRDALAHLAAGGSSGLKVGDCWA